MKRVLITLLCLLLIISVAACGKPSTEEVESGEPVVIMPDIETAATINGYKTIKNEAPKEESKPSVSKMEYYANKSSKKFHSSECRYAKSIKDSNLFITTSRDELIKDGYAACKNCNP